MHVHLFISFVQYSTVIFIIIIFLIFLLFLIYHIAGVGTPTSATVCIGGTTTLTCDISQSGGVAPVWRVFTTSDTSGSPVATLTSGVNIPPYNYPTVQAGDTVARLEVMASLSINGYHFQCRLVLVPPVDSHGTGTLTVRGMYNTMHVVVNFIIT